MIRGVQAEARKALTVPGTWLLVAAAIVVEIGVKVLLAALQDRQELDADARFGLLAPTLFLPLGAALVGLLLASEEWRYRMAVPTFLVEPRRWRVLAAKAIVALVGGAVVGFVGMVFSVGATVVVFESRFGDSPSLSNQTAIILGATAACALLAVAGAGLGTAVTSQVAAITLAAVVLWVLFPLALALGPEIAAWLPSGAIAALADQQRIDTDFLSVWAGAILMVVYAGLGLAAGARALSRREIGG